VLDGFVHCLDSFQYLVFALIVHSPLRKKTLGSRVMFGYRMEAPHANPTIKSV
jgi:hypothetical protein